MNTFNYHNLLKFANTDDDLVAAMTHADKN